MVPRAWVRVGLRIFFSFGEDLGGAIEPSKSLGKLRADRDELHDRRDHEGEEHDVGDVSAGGQLSGDDAGARRGT